MTAAMLAFLLVEHGGAAICGSRPGLETIREFSLRSARTQRSADGWIAVQLAPRDAHWQALVREAGLDDLIADPRLTNRALWRDPGFGYATLGPGPGNQEHGPVACVLPNKWDPRREVGREAWRS